MATHPRHSARKSEPFLPTWGYWLIGSVVLSLLTALLHALGVLSDLLSLIQLLGIFIGFIVIYFIPTIIGRSGKRPNAIFVANLFLGITGIGWVAVLIWAIAENESKTTTPTTP